MSVDLAYLKGWIGRAMEADDVVTPRLIAEYRATFEDRLAATASDEAPLGLHWCLAPPITPMSELGDDGHAAKGGFLPPIPLPRRMWAGGDIETHGPLRAGDTVTRRSVVEDVVFKEGRSGPLCFVTVRHAFSTPRGLALTERHDIVYRSAEGAAASPPPLSNNAENQRTPDAIWTIETSPVFLFRYSAMTFNGHRIHYDQPYVTGVEGYPGLVVHGPIQATLCLNMVATLAGVVPRRFRFRNLAPVTAGASFSVVGGRNPGGIACWTQNTQGGICMQGESPS